MAVVFGSLVESKGEPFHKPVAHLHVVPPFENSLHPICLFWFGFLLLIDGFICMRVLCAV